MIIGQVKKFITTFPLEALIWLSAFIALACVDPSTTEHVAICPFSYFGITICPGCGLGRSIAWLLHGSLWNSVRLHPLGIFAVAVLTHRIFKLIHNHSNHIWQK